jgi:hypothetical protein
MDNTGVVCKSNHNMLSHLANTNNLHYLASSSSLISTGHKIDCSFILENELYQIIPVTLPATMYSQNKTAIAAKKTHHRDADRS